MTTLKRSISLMRVEDGGINWLRRLPRRRCLRSKLASGVGSSVVEIVACSWGVRSPGGVCGDETVVPMVI